jgi:hypothetical protein
MATSLSSLNVFILSLWQAGVETQSIFGGSRRETRLILRSKKVWSFLVPWLRRHRQTTFGLIFRAMDQITIKTPKPKRHLYWCLIEFINSRYVTGEKGIGLCGEHIPDSEPTNLLYHPRGPQTDKHLPPGPFKVNFKEKPTFRVWCLLSYLVHV